MSSNLTATTESTQRGWAARLFGSLGPRRASAGAQSPSTNGNGQNGYSHTSVAATTAAQEVPWTVSRLIAEGRTAVVLSGDSGGPVEPQEFEAAATALDEAMALVPAGVVPVACPDGSVQPTALPAFFLDRFAVTNAQFQQFVKAGCYDVLEFWPREIWPGLMRFVDRTGSPGPRHWEQGKFPPGYADHPVVGICWYEAIAYARWVGKRLPTAAEWQKAGGWPEHLSGGSCTRYPWGDLYAEGRANLWASGLGRTAPVDAFREGATLNGIYQMSGNVWEWLEDPLEAIPCRAGETFRGWKPMRRIVGGAFDTYLPAEAMNQFVTGQSELDRRANIGFRCALSADRLQPRGGRA